VVLRLNHEIVAAINDPVIRKRLEDLNLDPLPGTPEQAASLLNSDIRRWGDVIERAKIVRQ
jgi:tripartite-type tricarboxylate transporter receptor subunit TctC